MAESSDRGGRRRAGGRSGGGEHADVYRLARTAGRVEGEIDGRALPRLSSALRGDAPSPIRYAIQGTQDEHGRPALDVSITGELGVTCQRCLGSMRMPLAHRTLLVVASTEAEAEAWDRDEHEVAVADRPVPLNELIEDEVLLALPYAPRHPEGECVAEAGTGGG